MTYMYTCKTKNDKTHLSEFLFHTKSLDMKANISCNKTVKQENKSQFPNCAPFAMAYHYITDT